MTSFDSSYQDPKTLLKNFSATLDILESLHEYNQTGKWHGKVVSRLGSLALTPLFSLIDTITHLTLGILKLPTSPFISFYNLTTKFTRLTKAPKELEISSALFHLYRALDNLFQTVYLPLIALFSPARAYHILEKKYGFQGLEQMEEEEPPTEKEIKPNENIPYSSTDPKKEMNDLYLFSPPPSPRQRGILPEQVPFILPETQPTTPRTVGETPSSFSSTPRTSPLSAKGSKLPKKIARNVDTILAAADKSDQDKLSEDRMEEIEAKVSRMDYTHSPELGITEKHLKHLKKIASNPISVSQVYRDIEVLIEKLEETETGNKLDTSFIEENHTGQVTNPLLGTAVKTDKKLTPQERSNYRTIEIAYFNLILRHLQQLRATQTIRKEESKQAMSANRQKTLDEEANVKAQQGREKKQEMVQRLQQNPLPQNLPSVALQQFLNGLRNDSETPKEMVGGIIAHFPESEARNSFTQLQNLQKKVTSWLQSDKPVEDGDEMKQYDLLCFILERYKSDQLSKRNANSWSRVKTTLSKLAKFTPKP